MLEILSRQFPVEIFTDDEIICELLINRAAQVNHRAVGADDVDVEVSLSAGIGIGNKGNRHAIGLVFQRDRARCFKGVAAHPLDRHLIDIETEFLTERLIVVVHLSALERQTVER
ncbi:MAG: Uncharacterised protein [Pseudidiomarina mangrovi]|nr:MAG: Uncharacterised protein [Pseudidiomarina mangrovi]